VGAASRRFAALAAAAVAPAGRAVVIDDGETRMVLEPLPLHLLPLSPERRDELSALGVKRLGELARLPGTAVADRLGADGAESWRLARGEGDASVTPRQPPSELVETLSFPEPIANDLTLARALAVLIERLLARPERAGRAPLQLALSAKLVGGGSWRRSLTLREPTAEPDRLRLALASRLAELPAPTAELRLELIELAESVGTQAELVRPRGSRLRERLRGGLRQVRAAVGMDAVCTVVEVAPWSRIPESRAILVPRDD
jgi:protein ImuB